jgi:hypothetical protein
MHPIRRLGAKQVDRGIPSSGRKRIGTRTEPALWRLVAGRRWLATQDRVQIWHAAHPPSGRIRLAAPGPIGPDFRRGAILAFLAEGALLHRIRLRLGGRRREGVGPLSPARGEDDPKAGELIYADLGRGQRSVNRAA